MAVKLRLVRIGKKKQPTYRLVAADSRSPRNGRFIEIVGTYAPRGKSLAEPDAALGCVSSDDSDGARSIPGVQRGHRLRRRATRGDSRTGSSLLVSTSTWPFTHRRPRNHGCSRTGTLRCQVTAFWAGREGCGRHTDGWSPPVAARRSTAECALRADRADVRADTALTYRSSQRATAVQIQPRS